VGPDTLEIKKDNKSPYAFFEDPSLWIFIALALVLLIRKWASGDSENAVLYSAMITIGLVFMLFILVDRNKMQYARLIIRFSELKFRLWLTLGNLVTMVSVSLLLYFLKGVTWLDIEENILVACWEQLLFAVAIPYALTRAIGIVFKKGDFVIWAYIPAVVISAVAFGFLHVYVYNFHTATIIYIILIGGALHFIGYLIPSTSMVLHFVINLIAISSMMVI